MSDSLLQLTLVRFREFYREPEAVFWTFVFPILMAAGLGIAFRNKPADILDIAATTPQLAAALRSGNSLKVQVMDQAAAAKAMSTGRILLLATPATGGAVTFRYDDTNPDARTARLFAGRALQKSAGVPDAVSVSEEIVREPGSRYIDFLLPGLLGMNLMGSGIWSLAFAIVDARRRKLLKRLAASPMSRAEYLLSFVLSRLAVLLIEVSVLVGFGRLAFGVPIRGAVWQLALLCVFASLAFCAVGLLIASRVRTVEAASGLTNFVMLPMWIFSGVFFSPERFPAILQPFIRALPLTAVINVLRSNMLQGAGLAQISTDLAIIGAWMIVSFFIALKLFRWR